MDTRSPSDCDRPLNLCQAAVGRDFQIKELAGPACRQLREIGFCENMRVRKLTDGRNLICKVCCTRLAVSRELAEQVWLAPA